MPNEPIRSLLLVDADPGERRRIAAIASRAGWTVVGADGVETALGILQGPYGREVRLALLGHWDCDHGAQLVEALRSAHAGLPILVVTDGEMLPATLGAAIRAGATDFLGRPLAPERLLEALNAASDRRRPVGELAPIAEKLAPELSLDQLVGATPEFRSTLAVAAKAARNRLPILIVGEPGTGKETFARAIHSASLRSRAQLVALDCKAIPANIIDSELFGHEAGAFPGAFSARQGRMVDASGGTLILDDITALPEATQEALDRTLATGEVRPVGCNGSHSVDVRLIATANAPLSDSFHAPLRERLEGTVVSIPPLRERSSDIPALARQFLARFAEQGLIQPLTIDNGGLTVLMRYGWPGNVRQLGSVLLRAGLECDGKSLSAEDFPHIATQSRFTGRASDIVPHMTKHSSDAAVSGISAIIIFDDQGDIRPLEEIEADLIRLAIGHYRGRMTEVAKRLGIGRSTLYRKLAEIGIETTAA
jgi:DNA-binding NtrC family response regulator